MRGDALLVGGALAGLASTVDLSLLNPLAKAPPHAKLGRDPTLLRCGAFRCARSSSSTMRTPRSRSSLGTGDATKACCLAWLHLLQLTESPPNPVRLRYGLKQGFRGRFGVYVPSAPRGPGPGRARAQPENNRMRAR